MSQDLAVVSYATETLFLLLSTGSSLWYLLAFRRGAGLLPPAQRLELHRAIGGRFLAVSWLFVVLTIIGFSGNLYYAHSFDFARLLSFREGILPMVEVVLLLIILLSLTVSQFVFVPQLKKAGLATIESPDISLKWKTTENKGIGIRATRLIMTLSTLNLALGITLILLVVLTG